MKAGDALTLDWRLFLPIESRITRYKNVDSVNKAMGTKGGANPTGSNG